MTTETRVSAVRVLKRELQQEVHGPLTRGKVVHGNKRTELGALQSENFLDVGKWDS